YGASAGAIVGAFLANGNSVAEIEKIILKITREDFWDPALGFGILKGHKFKSLLTEYLPENFEDLKTPLSVSAFDIFSLKTCIFNSGTLPDVIRASSALPGLFQPVKIASKYYIDGGVRDVLALKKRTENNIPLLVHYFDHGPLLTNGADRIKKQKSETIVLTLKDLPKSGPRKMHMGAQIVNLAYEQTLQLLESEHIEK
ncbi:MAG: patatin-like phospholipase family protein, partial [Pseudobdellovibrio sp.]